MAVAVPPFESFYDTHKDEVLGFLRKRVGGQRADDLFQDTFLRALRAYDRLEHGEHLRAWVLTIASHLIVDGARRERPQGELTTEPGGEDARPAFEELAPLTDGLPPKERAAVVLRYGYDLDYDRDRRRSRLERGGGATGGLRRRAAAARAEGAAMNPVSTTLDERFRAAAAAAKMLDLAYDVLEDTPVGPLLVGVTDRGLARISFDPDPERQLEQLARLYGPRVLRSGRPVDRVRRELDEYFDGRRRDFDLELDLRAAPAFHRRVLEELARVGYGHTTTYGALAARAGNPRAARAVGTAMNRNPVPIVLPCHRVVGSNGSLTGYGGGLDRKEWLLRLEGAIL